MIDRIIKTRVLFFAAATLIIMLGARQDVRAQGAFDNVRLEVGGGIQVGDPEIEFAGVSDELDTDAGIAVGAAVWVDGVGYEHLSIGVQYLRLMGNDFSESASGVLLGVAFAGTLEIEPTIDAFMVNVALRKNDGKFHPYIGGGIGLAQTSADITASIAVVVNGVTFAGVGTADDSDTNFAAQGFVGVDVDLTDNIYLGVNARFLHTSAELFGADVDLGQFAGMGVVGFRL